MNCEIDVRAVVSRTGAWLTRQNVISDLCFQQLAEELVFLANDDIFEWRTQDIECALKQIGITQTFEGCYLGNLSEVVIIIAPSCPPRRHPLRRQFPCVHHRRQCWSRLERSRNCG
jgi:hypothetical protein